MKKYLSNERGLSLVEVVAAVALLTIILTAVYYILIQNSKMNALNYTHHSASALAREISAEITAKCMEVDFDFPVDSICLPENTSNTPNTQTYFNPNYNGFQVQFEIAGAQQLILNLIIISLNLLIV